MGDLKKTKSKKHRFTFKWRPQPKHLLWLALVLVVGWAAWIYFSGRSINKVSDIFPSLAKNHKAAVGGKIVSEELLRNYSADEVNALARQNYGNGVPGAKYAISKRLIKYTSVDSTGHEIEEYARVYVPRTTKQTPVISFAPGTTGLGDECAASLEQPWKADWANYDSHMAAYAGQGYAMVITDYEGMRDPDLLHHYMVGELEGRAVLDAARAAFKVGETQGQLDPNQLFLAGYSQGGQAAGWADRLAPAYAPELKIRGLVAFAPVSSLSSSLADITRGSTLSWFGPYVLVSFGDYYHQNYPLSSILLSKWIPTLKNDVLGHCINSVKYWGPHPEDVYTPAFLNALKTNTLDTSYPDLASEMAKNDPWTATTATPKLINQGAKDNVILPDQQTRALPQLCAAGTGPVQLSSYPNASHYTVMVQSFRDVLTWLNKVSTGQSLPTSCPQSLGGV